MCVCVRAIMFAYVCEHKCLGVHIGVCVPRNMYLCTLWARVCAHRRPCTNVCGYARAYAKCRCMSEVPASVSCRWYLPIVPFNGRCGSGPWYLQMVLASGICQFFSQLSLPVERANGLVPAKGTGKCYLQVVPVTGTGRWVLQAGGTCQWYLPSGSWQVVPVVPGQWYLASASWQVVPGKWFLQVVPGKWFLARGSWQVVPGKWFLASGTWQVVPG